jgi:hypothetical protein
MLEYAKDTTKKGTAVKQNYQTIEAAATALAVPEAVALGEVLADVRESLLVITPVVVTHRAVVEDNLSSAGPRRAHQLASHSPAAR